MSKEGGGQYITNSPHEHYPTAQGYLVDAKGQPLCGSNGELILGMHVRFKKLHVSGVEFANDECLGISDNRVMSYLAAQSKTPIYLRQQGGYFQWGQLNEHGVCSTTWPDKVVSGRLLVIDQVQPESCNEFPCDEQWCIRELDSGLEDEACAVMTINQTENGSEVVYISPPAEAVNGGIIHFDKDTKCPEFEEEESGIRYVDSEGNVAYANLPDPPEDGEEACYNMKLCYDENGDLDIDFDPVVKSVGSYAFLAHEGIFLTSGSSNAEITDTWTPIPSLDPLLYELSGTSLKVLVAGTYSLVLSTGVANQDGGAAGFVNFQIMVNGTPRGEERHVGNVSQNDSGNGHFTTIVDLDENDLIKVVVNYRGVTGTIVGRMRMLDAHLILQPI